MFNNAKVHDEVENNPVLLKESISKLKLKNL